MNSEELLIKRAVAGDEDSFNQIIEIYKNYVFAIILNFIKDYGEVENVAQEVFLQIYISLPNYDNDNFKGWVSRITSNKSIDWIRKKKSKFKEETLEITEVLVENSEMSSVETPEQLLIKKEDSEELAKVLNGIPDIYREVLEKFYYKEMSYEEIAKEEDVAVKTIASRLYRGKNLLKEKWREGHETL